MGLKSHRLVLVSLCALLITIGLMLGGLPYNEFNWRNALAAYLPPPPLPPLAAPSDLSATATSMSTIELSWTDNSDDEYGFFIESSLDGTYWGGGYDWAWYNTTSYTDRSYGDSWLACGTLYYYRVRAYRLSDNYLSEYSNVASESTYSCDSPSPVPAIDFLRPTLDYSWLDVIGTGFVDTSVIRWNGSDRLTYYASPWRLVTEITEQDIASGGTVTITVFNPDVGHGGGGVSNALTFTFGQPNRPPIAFDDYAVTNEDEPVTVEVTANDLDEDGNLDPTMATQWGHPSHGTTWNNWDGSIVYTPDPNYNGTDSFPYLVCDIYGLCSAPATVNITINPVNDAPAAVDDEATTNEDTSVTIDVLANDSDVDGDMLTVDSVTNGNSGSVANNAASVTYTPNANYNGMDSFSYQVCDADGACAAATVTITIAPINDAPAAIDDQAATNEDTSVTIDVLANDLDVDGDILTVDSVTNGSNGMVVNNGSNVTYAPNPNFNGMDSFSYTVSDGNGGSATANVSVTVSPVNDAPVAGDDAAITDEDVAVVIAVLANDSDVDGHPLIVESVTPPLNGTVVNNGSNVTYAPNPNFNGTDSFSYTLSDRNGGSATANVSVTVSPVNDAPVAGDDAAITDEDVAVVIAVLANDSDVDGDPLTINTVTPPLNGTVVNNGSNMTYAPNPNFNGTDSFSYQVCDAAGACAAATVTITITAVNDPPICTAVYPSKDFLWPPEYQMETVTVLGVTDPEGDLTTITITGILQDEPTSGLEDGDMSPDGQGVGTDTALVRAERSGQGNGRMYHIIFSATDGHGGSCEGTVLVGVHHDQGSQGGVVDDGPSYDSTVP